MKNGIRLKIAPSILSADFGRLAEQVKAAEEGGADCIHIDVMDGRFVPNISVGPLVVRAVHGATTLPLYVHLMIVEPESYISQFAEAGADLVEVHQETCPHLYRTVQQIKSSGASAGVAINPATPASSLEEILQYVDSVLVMTGEPGFGAGQDSTSEEYARGARARSGRGSGWRHQYRNRSACRGGGCQCTRGGSRDLRGGHERRRGDFTVAGERRTGSERA